MWPVRAMEIARTTPEYTVVVRPAWRLLSLPSFLVKWIFLLVLLLLFGGGLVGLISPHTMTPALRVFTGLMLVTGLLYWLPELRPDFHAAFASSVIQSTGNGLEVFAESFLSRRMALYPWENLRAVRETSFGNGWHRNLVIEEFGGGTRILEWRLSPGDARRLVDALSDELDRHRQAPGPAVAS